MPPTLSEPSRALHANSICPSRTTPVAKSPQFAAPNLGVGRQGVLDGGAVEWTYRGTRKALARGVTVLMISNC